MYCRLGLRLKTWNSIVRKLRKKVMEKELQVLPIARCLPGVFQVPPGVSRCLQVSGTGAEKLLDNKAIES